MTIKRIAVLGAGHGGHAAVADLTRRGFEVRLQARREQSFDALRENGGVEISGNIHEGFVPFDNVTTDVAKAVDGADLVMLVVPSVAHEHYAKALAPLLTPDLPVFINPGHTGGGLHFVHALREAGYRDEVRTCESVTLTYICRMEGPAKIGLYSYTKNLKFAAFPGRHADDMVAAISPIFPNIKPVSSVLETGLANLNAVFHPPGMVMNTGWIQRTGGDFLFYREGITDAVGRLISVVDRERVAVAKAIDVPTVTFLENFHDVGLTTKAAMESGSVSRACEESEPNKTVKCPSTLDHRYMHEDIGYGLVPIAELGKMGNVATPTIDAFIHLGSEAVGVDYATTGLTLEKMGLAGKSPHDLNRFLVEGH